MSCCRDIAKQVCMPMIGLWSPNARRWQGKISNWKACRIRLYGRSKACSPGSFICHPVHAGLRSHPHCNRLKTLEGTLTSSLAPDCRIAIASRQQHWHAFCSKVANGYAKCCCFLLHDKQACSHKQHATANLQRSIQSTVAWHPHDMGSMQPPAASLANWENDAAHEAWLEVLDSSAFSRTSHCMAGGQAPAHHKIWKYLFKY